MVWGQENLKLISELRAWIRVGDDSHSVQCLSLYSDYDDQIHSAYAKVWKFIEINEGRRVAETVKERRYFSRR